MVEQQVDGRNGGGGATPVGGGPLERNRVTPRVRAWGSLLAWAWVVLLLASVAAVVLRLPALRAALALPLS